MPKEANSTLFRGLGIMQHIAQASRGLSIAELVYLSKLPKPTVHRITLQLEGEGYLQRAPDKRFTIGRQFKLLALQVHSNLSVAAPRHAILQTLSDTIGETCNCTILDANQTVYFDRVECNWPIKVDLSLGSRLPLHATASGKLFLAYMKPQERKRLLQAAPLSENTPRTITCPDILEKELKAIKKEALGYDNEEFLTGMVALAVPVFDRNNNIYFTVAVHAPTTRQSLESLREHIPALRKAAKALTDSYC